MKKLTLSILALLTFCSAVFAEEKDGPGVYPFETETQSNEEATLAQSHWSIYIPVGFTFADMDESHGAKLGSGISDMTMNLGFGVEYSFTPTWSVSLEFNTANYGKHSFTSTKEDDGKRKEGTSLGVIYNMEAWLQYDLMDGFFPKRQQTIFNLYAMVGAGLGFYTYQRDGDDSFSSTLGAWKNGKLKNFDRDPFIGVGALADFNLKRNVSLGIRAMYQYYMSDNLDYGSSDVASSGGEHSVHAGGNTRMNSNNDGLFTADLVLHYNFTAREKSHVRNMAPGTLAMLEKKAEDAEKEAAKDDFVPQKDTLVISHKDTLVMIGENSKEKETLIKSNDFSDLYFVYFDNDKYTLNERGHIEVQQMAARLEAHPDACLELSGHTDATASDAYNAKLAERRAATVRAELINIYGIDESRLVDLGRGKITNVGSSFGPNRRVDMRVVSRAEVDSIRAEKEANATKKPLKKAEQPAAKVATEKAETSKAEAAEESDEEDELDSEAVEEAFDTTKYIAVEKTGAASSLSKLARKYYNNTHCWVYIYLENKDVIKTPNYLWPNTKLYIPRLTDEQKAITKEAADAMFGGE